MLRSAVMASVIALSCVGLSQPADAQGHGSFSGGHSSFSGGHGGWGGGHGGWGGGNRFFFGFGFGPGFGYWGYPYYPYYPAYYYPPYYPYPYYPPYGGYPGAYPGAGPAAANPGATVSAIDPATVREVQAELKQRGYDVGAVDGRLGPRTKTAIREFEQQNHLVADGLPTQALRDRLSRPAG